MNARLAAHAVLLTAVVWTHAPLNAATVSHSSPVDDGLPSLEFSPPAPPEWMQIQEASIFPDDLPGDILKPAVASTMLPPSYA